MMRTAILFAVIIMILCASANGETMGSLEDESLVPEVRSLLDVISRLARVHAKADRSLAGSDISVCFQDSQAFRPVIGVLKTYRGNFQWVALTRLPYVCFVPVLGEQNVVPPIHQMRTLAIQDIVALTTLIEHRLNLSGLPGKGVVVENVSERAADHGPGGPALLVADPRTYLSNGLLPTSEMDREVDYWITDEEGDLMYDRLHPSEGALARPTEMPMLKRVCNSKYEDLIVIPSEVAALKEEARSMADASPDLTDAMARIGRVCDVALQGHLGIVVLGQ
jgi:hypothetical protein